MEKNPILCEKFRRFQRPALHIALIIVLGLIAYSNTFQSPFQWDEYGYIKDNPIVKDLSYFIDPSKAKGLGMYSSIKARYVGYLTFALNYRINGYDVTGYHIFNFVIHSLNAVLLYYLIRLTFQTPFLRISTLSGCSNMIAFISSVIFITHPIQTEAVTYIFQRLASLSTLFYLGSLTGYVASRLSTTKRRRYFFYGISFISAALAMKTKENAFTIPVAIALYEFMFFSGPIKRRALTLVPLILTMLIIPLTFMELGETPDGVMGQINASTKGFQCMPRTDYFLTQIRVMATYLRLLILPMHQNIDYDYPVYHTFYNPEVILSFLLLLIIIGFSVYLFYLSQRVPEFRLVSFGAFWFLITLSVESSIIPIPMVIDEYRVYLPSALVFPAAVTALLLFIRNIKTKIVQTSITLILLLIPFVLTYASHERNSVWKTEISLWEDTVKKSPHKARGHNNLGNAYLIKNMPEKAIEHYQTALTLLPVTLDPADIHLNLGISYLLTYKADKAVMHLKESINLRPYSPETHYSLGIAYQRMGDFEKSMEHYRLAVNQKPNFMDAIAKLNQLTTEISQKALSSKNVAHSGSHSANTNKRPKG